MCRFLFLSAAALTLLCLQQSGDAFLTTKVPNHLCSGTAGTELFMGKTRKARKNRKAKKVRPQFIDVLEEEATGNRKERAKKKRVSTADDDDEDLEGKSYFEVLQAEEDKKFQNKGVNVRDAEREARAEEARRRMESRPDVSTLIVDEDSGIEVIAQGKYVMDVVTRKPVVLSSPEYRLAQLFPGVPPPIRDKYRFDWRIVEVPEMVDALRMACSVKLEDGGVGIPPHPSVANKAIDFVLANRDYLGYKMKRCLGRLQMRSMWKGNKDGAREYAKLWTSFLTIENHISAPFRQMVHTAEGRVGPNFGNLDLMSFCDGEVHERVANYFVLKGMVAHWEMKVKDAEFYEKTPKTKENFASVIATGDPRRYLDDCEVLVTLRECTQVCLMAQQMCKTFVETEELFSDFPPEIRFLEKALTIKGGTPLRKYMIEQFCPAEGITPEGLREGMRRLYQQFVNMQIDPYGDLTMILHRLNLAMAVETDDMRDPYRVYLANPDPDGPGYFQTYTFNEDELSHVRFLDKKFCRDNNEKEAPEMLKAKEKEMKLPSLFGGKKETRRRRKYKADGAEPDFYIPPPARAAGRPHELGWLELLDDEVDENMRFGKVPPGRIIPDEEAGI